MRETRRDPSAQRRSDAGLKQEIAETNVMKAFMVRSTACGARAYPGDLGCERVELRRPEQAELVEPSVDLPQARPTRRLAKPSSQSVWPLLRYGSLDALAVAGNLDAKITTLLRECAS
jgi:hypothetical protein